MGIKANFSVNQVMNAVNAREKVASRKLEGQLEKASKELAGVIFDLAPVKSGTLQKAVRRKKGRSKGSWVVYINETQKVPNRRITVGQYLDKIESGNFARIGRRSREKEAAVDRRRLAGLRVRRSPQGSYVGGEFFSRAEEAIIPKWEKRMAKTFRDEMRRGPRVFVRNARGRFA